MERIERLRNEALCFRHTRDEFYYRFYKTYANREGDEEERYGEAFCDAFSYLTPVIGDGELIVGRYEDHMSDGERAEWEAKYREIKTARCRLAGGGQDSHMAIDYALLLKEGIRGILARISGLEADADDEKRKFYTLCRRTLLAVARHAENYAALAERMAGEATDPMRVTELLEIARICRRVPMEPAESFYEAVQSVHFISYVLSLNPFRDCAQQFQLGRPDRYLLPFYENDIKRGVLTRERAQLLLDCLGIQINNRVPSGLSSGYMVGGRREDGSIVENDLTEMLMQVVDDIRLVYPAVGLCCTDGMNPKFLERACEILSHGRSHPAIFNDDVIARGLVSWGVPEEEARDYVQSTCVEITPIAASNVWVASPYTNMAQLLLDTMEEAHESFEALMTALYRRLDERIACNLVAQRRMRAHRAVNSRNPLLSCFVGDCLARGLDIEAGGARYNWVMPSFVGMANLVDSLYAVRRMVYEEKRISLGELKKILDANFEGQEPLRAELLNRLPKYGNNDDTVDVLFGELVSHIVAKCRALSAVLPVDEALIPSVFCWVMHERFGRETGATPDGRVAGFPLGDGSGPCQGRERGGPTASILSSTKWEHADLIGGVAVNMKFSKSALGSGSVAAMQALVSAFLLRGGFEMQINVTDREILERARACPEEYHDLVVRIGGYSDYFTRLSDEMQRELILRTEHKI